MPRVGENGGLSPEEVVLSKAPSGARRVVAIYVTPDGKLHVEYEETPEP